MIVVTPQASANRVEYSHGALTEWYVNGPLGLEQGFTLEVPPGPRPGPEPVTLALRFSGDLKQALNANGGLTLTRAYGTPERYQASAYVYEGQHLAPR